MERWEVCLLLSLGNRIITNKLYLCNYFFNHFRDATALELVLVYVFRREVRNVDLKPEAWLIDYDNIEFFSLFRMQKKTMNLLISVLRKMDKKQSLQKRYVGGFVPTDFQQQVLIFVWYMATQDSLKNIGHRFKVSHTRVMTIVNHILYFVVQMKKQYIKFPTGEDELNTVMQGFPTYPGVIGAVDGTHVFVQVEKSQQESYIDRFRRHSINIMAVCDSKALFTYSFIGFPGSAHDSRVFQNSQFFKHIERYGPNSIFLDDKKYHLVGDSAFGLRSWLMTPYRDNMNLTREQKNHNRCLSSARVVIEHAFGLLKGRWRRLIYICTYNICKTIEIATAALVLHNFCLINEDLWTEHFEEERPQVFGDVAIEEAGRTKRDRIARNLLQN